MRSEEDIIREATDPSRNLSKVLDKVIEYLRGWGEASAVAQEVIKALEAVKSDAGFTAPEAQAKNWTDAAMVLQAHFGDPPWEDTRICFISGIFNGWQPPEGEE